MSLRAPLCPFKTVNTSLLRVFVEPLCRQSPIARTTRLLPRTLHHVRIPPPTPCPCRAFSSSPIVRKKGGKAARAQSADAPSSSPSSSASPAADDPFDFSVLESDIAKVHERLQHELKKLRLGGRFNPEVLEALRVHLVKGGKESVRLGDVAQVIPKGRVVQLVVGEKDHIKPITSAILSSTLSLTPQPDPANPSLLSIPIPPATADSRRAAIAEAQDAAKAAAEAICNARGTQQKKLRAMQLGKKALPDDLRKAAPLMEKLVDKGTKEITRILDAAKKVLEG